MRLNKLTSVLVLCVVGLAGTLRAEVKVGDKFPDLAACKLEGTIPDDTKGKVVLVDFWASWCGPCAKSFPTMEELQKTYGPRGLVIVAVSVDDKQKNMTSFLKDHQVSFAVVRDAKQKLVEKTGIETMPSSFLVGRDGVVAFAHSGFHGAETKREYEQQIESLLEKK